MIYVNSQENRLDLNKDPYWLYYEPILNYEWDYATKDKKRGHILAGFTKDVKELDVDLAIWGHSDALRNQAIDKFNNLIDIDIYNGTAGKLYYGDWFTYGYFIAAENTDWEKGAPIVRKKMTFVREKLSWYHIVRVANFGEQANEDLYNFVEEEIKTFEVEDYTGQREGYNYEYDYMVDTQSQKTITNPGSIPCEFIVSIQGYINNPVITIGDTTISVNVEVPYGANLVVDSTQKTVTLTLIDGTKINCFGARDPDYYLFERIAPGKSTVTWNGSFLWELQMIEERSEPRWHMG